jgi:hypothetical protein
MKKAAPPKKDSRNAQPDDSTKQHEDAHQYRLQQARELIDEYEATRSKDGAK